MAGTYPSTWLELQGNLPGVSQVHVAVGRSKVQLYVDCRKVAERPIGEAGSPPATGFVTLGRLAKARGPRSSSAAVSLGFALPDQPGASGPPAFPFRAECR